jgi:hypothetical protein
MINSEFDICRTQVAKDCVSAYLNFRFSTQYMVEKMREFIVKKDKIDTVQRIPNDAVINDGPLYSCLSLDSDDSNNVIRITSESTAEEVTRAYNLKKQYYTNLKEEDKPSNISDLLNQLDEAHDILTNSDKKNAYNFITATSKSEGDVALYWSKKVHRFAIEIAMAWDRNDPRAGSMRILYVLKDFADGSVNYVIISFMLMLYLSGLGFIVAMAPNMFIQMLVTILQWLGVASSLIEHVTNIGATLIRVGVDSTDIINKTIKIDFGNIIVEKLFMEKPELVSYVDSILAILKNYSREEIDTLNSNEFAIKVKTHFENDRKSLVQEFLLKRQFKLIEAKEKRDFLDIRTRWSTYAFLDIFSQAHKNGEISGALFLCVLAELAFNELCEDPAIFYPHVKDTVERIESYSQRPWIPLFVFSEGRDRYSVGGWTRYTESINWNLYNDLKERVERCVNWRSYEHQKDFFRIHLKHLSDCGVNTKSVFPHLTKSCSGEPSDTQWKTRHLVLYAHGKMSGPIKLLRKYRIKSR